MLRKRMLKPSKTVLKKKVSTNSVSHDIEKDFETVEHILGSKNINYGYGDSKNREKVLKFITDMKKQQT